LQATRAKRQFDGKLAKGQPMEIAFDTAPLRTSSLLSRIERPSLAERLSGGAGPKQQGGAGLIRTRQPRSARVASSSKAKAPKPTRSKTPSAEQLDQELDTFMADDKSVAVKKAATVDDVEMA
jgi:THO complex subunit 4